MDTLDMSATATTSDALNGILTSIGELNPELSFSGGGGAAGSGGEKGRLCLNMIVKNESKIIERLLGSVLSIVDTYCICDTGSTDDTAEKIRAFMAAAGKKGEVYTEPFRNFGYNRTHALERAARWGTYALLLDADMKLVIEPSFNVDQLTADGYSIIQRAGGLEYFNVRIVKTGIGVRCMGPTHEYYDFPNGRQSKQLTSLWIQDIGDGGAKGDKFERDVRLLLKGIEDEPNNDRYHFYLANSYRDLGRPHDAITYYKKRASMGGWIEENFYACYELGNMYKSIGDMGNAVFWWLEAWERHPKRIESLYEVIKYYREVGKQKLGMAFCMIARATPYPQGDLLFIKRNIYDYLIEYEYSILSYYTGSPIDHYRYLSLIGTDYNKDNVLSNYRCYVKKLKQFQGVRDIVFDEKVDKHVGGRDDTFVSSSPCILSQGDGYLLNVRYVNYHIRPDGSYQFRHDDGKITTLNRTYWLNKHLEVVDSRWLDAVADETLRYQGVEDVKVFQHRSDLLFLGTVQQTNGVGHITVGHGAYTLTDNKLVPTAFTSPFKRECEKNWCYAHDTSGKLKLVYQWSPLMIAELTPDQQSVSIVTTHKEVPAFFRDVRGSSNGCLVGDELWFLCHYVHYSTPRHYYHLIVVLDAVTMAYKRHSILFKFHGDSIEYALGMVVEPERLLFSYSKMDRTSAVMVVPRSVVDDELFPVQVIPKGYGSSGLPPVGGGA